MGVAISDPGGILAVPLTVIHREKLESDLEAIRKLVLQYEVKCIVAGLPRSLNGSLGHQAERVQDFVNQLSQYISTPIETWDERLSTVAAGRLMSEAGVKRQKQKKRIDAMAATLILQGYLDRRHARDEDEL